MNLQLCFFRSSPADTSDLMEIARTALESQRQQQTRATTAPIPVGGLPPSASASASANAPDAAPVDTTLHRIRLVPHLDSRCSLRFEPISGNLEAGEPALRIRRIGAG
ncbi:hypothetical protein B0H10DRAFT_2233040 [Mycena sp. CBHHK59/15]|nr:hypothetical protein B0H10DRAFT_2233040 [Mycena sp. CBHHK59/15]